MIHPATKQSRAFRERCARFLTITPSATSSTVTVHEGETCLSTADWDVGFDNLDALIKKTVLLMPASLILNLSEAQVFTQTLVVDSLLSDGLIMAFIASKFSTLFGEPDEYFLWDYTKTHQTDTQQEITIAAVPKSFMDPIIDTFLTAGLHIDKITIVDYLQAINLMPWRKQLHKTQQRKKIAWVAGGVLLSIAIIVMAQMFFSVNMHHNQVIIATLQKTQDAQKNPDMPQQTDLLQTAQKIQSDKLQSQKSNRHIATLLHDIANDLIPTITLTQLSWNNHHVDIQGTSASLSDIHRYANTLQQQWQNLKIQLTDIRTDSQLHFTLRGDS